MSVIHPKYLTNGSHHRYDSCSIDITKFKGDKKEDDREEVKKKFHRLDYPAIYKLFRFTWGGIL
jgi:hypothetical protein